MPAPEIIVEQLHARASLLAAAMDSAVSRVLKTEAPLPPRMEAVALFVALRSLEGKAKAAAASYGLTQSEIDRWLGAFVFVTRSEGSSNG